MGVPRLLRIILEKYPKSHTFVKDVTIDYLFIDFNSIIYESFEYVMKHLKHDINVEEQILNEMINITRMMIVDNVKPKKLVYISIDGTPPKGKMIEQRSRRYKKLYSDMMQKGIYEKHGQVMKSIWNTTYITPGTKFMAKVTEYMKNAIVTGIMPKYLEYILSDVSVPGEGEHKFLPYIETLNERERICIYSNDGDMIMLMNRFPHHESYIMTKVNLDIEVIKLKYKEEKYIYLIKDEIYKGMLNYFSDLKINNEEEQRRFIRDYTFITMLGGNDFVKHIYFLRLKEQHSYNLLINMYISLRKSYGWLTNNDLTLNVKFLVEIMKELGKQEMKWCKKIQQKTDNPNKSKYSPSSTCSNAWEEEWKIFEHTPYYKKEHPQYELYIDEFSRIDFTSKNWKEKYYNTFFGKSYNLKDICVQYLKSLFYTFKYYFNKPPNWSFYYPYHASPLPSDIYYYMIEMMKDKTLTQIFKFTKDGPYKPLEQLMLVLPKKNDILDENLKNIMNELSEYYPDDFILDVIWGQKFIYSEPILPDIDETIVFEKMGKVKLSKEQEKLNKINMDPLYFSL